MKLTANQLEEFFENGFLILSDLFTTEEIDAALKAVERVYLDVVSSSRNKTHIKNGARIVFEGESLHRIVWCRALDPIFGKIGEDPRLLSPISQLLNNSKELIQLINQLHFKMPHDGVAFDCHQDAQHRSYGTDYWRDILGNGSFIQTALALDPMTKDNGPLEFYQGSHRGGDLGGQEFITSKVLSSYKKVILELDQGSLALFHPFVIHGSGPNQSSSPRRILINGYTVPGVNSFEYPGCGTGLRLNR